MVHGTEPTSGNLHLEFTLHWITMFFAVGIEQGAFCWELDADFTSVPPVILLHIPRNHFFLLHSILSLLYVRPKFNKFRSVECNFVNILSSLVMSQ